MEFNGDPGVAPGAHEADCAQEAVPIKPTPDPVDKKTEAVTVFRAALEPDTISFFQFGILYF
jgi:hypothetical protein